MVAMTQTLPDPAHNHKLCISQALTTAEQLCGARGVQLTPIRHQVLELIWASHKAVKAYELLDLLKPLQHAAKPVTVYRALDFLIEQGLIHRVESLNAFVGCRCSDKQHEQLLLICKHCQEVEERYAPEVMSALSEEINKAGFTVHSKAIEIQGVCTACRHLPLPQSNGQTT
ncbi:MAG: transcriptional repressor [Methylococcaceae bacterium]|nr:transcriptional repressor [Methylococcaceae bacterium]